jgi:hypothetical protein
MTNTATSTDSAGLFSAPRKFDLSTMLVVTTAYAAVFALLRAISFPAMDVFIVSAFFTSVALGQAILFGAKHPRWASALVGSAFGVILLIASPLIYQHGRPPDEIPPPPLILTNVILCVIFGAFYGYVGGVIVGFVFMIAHGIRLVLSSDDSRPDISDK